MPMGHHEQRKFRSASLGHLGNGGTDALEILCMNPAVDQNVLCASLVGTLNRKKSPKPTRNMRTRKPVTLELAAVVPVAVPLVVGPLGP